MLKKQKIINKLKKNSKAFNIIGNINIVLFYWARNLIFSIKKIAAIKINIKINNLIINFNRELPKLGCLLYLSCILFEFI